MKVLKKKLHWKYSKFMKLSVLFILLYASVNAQIINKSIEKTVDLPANTLIDINTGYDINYKTWDKNRLKVVFNINCEAKTVEIANSFYSEIKKSVNAALTDINKGSIKISIPFKRLIEKPLSNSVKIKMQTNHKTYHLKKYKMSITIYAPKKNNLKLQSHFADVRIEDLEADANINVQTLKDGLYIEKCKNLKLHAFFCNNIDIGTVENADITLHSSKLHKIGKINNNLTLNSRFSSFSVSAVQNADVVLHSSTFEIDEVQNMDLDASFAKNIRINNLKNLNIKRLNSSNIKVNKLMNLKAQSLSFSTLDLNEISNCTVELSRSSQLYIDRINNMEITNASFSRIKINELAKTLICSSKSGNIDVKNVKRGFQKIKVDGSFVNINMDMGTCSYKFAVDLKYPNLVVRDEKFKGLEELAMSFTIGLDKDTKSEVSFDCDNCKIRIDDF